MTKFAIRDVIKLLILSYEAQYLIINNILIDQMGNNCDFKTEKAEEKVPCKSDLTQIFLRTVLHYTI